MVIVGIVVKIVSFTEIVQHLKNLVNLSLVS